ncbi:small ribosomal subunit protein bS6m-like [Watersipora subatra]|uniref:small ribosomal subunit protein bS6m-like n=1 Tax=Watersipora subatra TaxID=2589382 RepID=UPI00355C8A97
MPPYELSLILKSAAKPELKEIIKRTLMCVKEHGGLVGRLENLGERQLPAFIKKQSILHSRGFYMFVEANIPAHKIASLSLVLSQDKDVLRPTILRGEVEMPRPCEQGQCFFGELNNTELAMARKWGRFQKVSI